MLQLTYQFPKLSTERDSVSDVSGSEQGCNPRLQGYHHRKILVRRVTATSISRRVGWWLFQLQPQYLHYVLSNFPQVNYKILSFKSLIYTEASNANWLFPLKFHSTAHSLDFTNSFLSHPRNKTYMADSGDFFAEEGESGHEYILDDVDMGGDEAIVEIASAAPQDKDDGMPFQEEPLEEVPARVTYIDYLRSPAIGLLVGQGDEQALLTAHQALLVQSPWFADACAKFSSEVSVSKSLTFCMSDANRIQERRIDLVDEDLDAVGCFLEYLYTNDYFPRKLAGTRDLERDAATPEVDETGDQLLKHARVYTLAQTLHMPALKSLASSKIHCVNSTAKGEIAYARYVYAHTEMDDTAIRAPVANFWATRSHTLRSEAEEEFRTMCLEFPQFGYDVLSKPHSPDCQCHELTSSQRVFSMKNLSAKRPRDFTLRPLDHRGRDLAKAYKDISILNI
jgi:hypothetical protein